MKFRSYTSGDYSKVLGKPYLEYKLYFYSEKDDIFKSCDYKIENGKIIRKNLDTKIANEIIQKRIGFDEKEYIDYKFNDFEIDIEQLQKEPIKLISLRHLIIAIKTTNAYKSFISKIIKKYPDEKIDFNWYSGYNFNLEVGLMFPDIYSKIYMNRDLKVDLMELFEFITENINFNKLFENERLKITEIKNKGFYSRNVTLNDR